MNVHKLRHLVMYVKLYGPLFTTSLFGYESMNGHLKKCLHGTKFTPEQITFARTMSWELQRLAVAMQKTNESEDVVKLACQLTNLAGSATGVSATGDSGNPV
ncbi:Hypp567 [Branchiostoma lanceolatum]|uniref:Hypp567 protein n=1 Tax=Branchiostoma lanceolatum TaxID=7740 RepID=A0A8J9YP98_BRALA|nr:Hypp567 [Branchiostoma lanceolatum]